MKEFIELKSTLRFNSFSHPSLQRRGVILFNALQSKPKLKIFN